MRLLTAVCLSVLSFAATAEAQSDTTRIDWPKGMSASDKRDVLALASRMGIAEPARVEFNRVLILGNRFLRVKSRALEDGHELRWNEVTMIRDSWQEYDDLPVSQSITPGLAFMFRSSVTMSSSLEWALSRFSFGRPVVLRGPYRATGRPPFVPGVTSQPFGPL